ncbi:TetR/AcrR family transcriptional regulator [Mycobacterium paraseoulense]|uniref:TetR/AcrR family transcriptional regulator n=1 Tax=Mycobacterium paraseoulense TaxID=590652 RepID=UPI0013CF8819|nr:TetR/AcrR family transcriptional regulator [Mycobacterium paraseoulense]
MIIDAAATLFSDQGYGNVSMSDVADAVAVGASALYRHFPSKQALLATVIEDALGTLDQALKGADASADLAAVLARLVQDHRTVGVLWRREGRHLRSRTGNDCSGSPDRSAIDSLNIFDTGDRTWGPRRPTCWHGVRSASRIAFHSIAFRCPSRAFRRSWPG